MHEAGHRGLTAVVATINTPWGRGGSRHRRVILNLTTQQLYVANVDRSRGN